LTVRGGSVDVEAGVSGRLHRATGEKGLRSEVRSTEPASRRSALGPTSDRRRSRVCRGSPLVELVGRRGVEKGCCNGVHRVSSRSDHVVVAGRSRAVQATRLGRFAQIL